MSNLGFAFIIEASILKHYDRLPGFRSDKELQKKVWKEVVDVLAARMPELTDITGIL